MRIEDFNQYKFTGSSQYNLDEFNYVVAVKEDSNFSNKNILPLYYVTNDYELLGIDEEIGERVLVLSTQKDTITEDIATRFSMNELFKIIRGPFQLNDRYEFDHNVPKTKIYKNYLQPLEENEVIELFEANIDVERSRILIKDTQLRDMVNKKYLDSSQVIMCLYQNEVIGPFHLTRSDTEEFFIAKKSQTFKFGVHSVRTEDIIEIVANGITRRLIYNPSILNDTFRKDFDFLSTKELLYWFENDILNKQNSSLLKNSNLSGVIEHIDRINNSAEVVESKDRYERLFRILSNANETLISKQSLLSALPEFSIVKEELELLDKKRLELRNSIDDRIQNLEEVEKKLFDLSNQKNDLIHKISELKNQQEVEQNKIRDDIRNEISELEKQKSLLNKEIESERSALSETLENLKEDIKYQEKRKSELNTAIDTLKKNFTSEQKDAQEKLAELVKQNTHFNFISGRDLPSDNSREANFKNYTLPKSFSVEYGQLRAQLVEIFKSQQRFFENHFVDNILICIHQNLLTLFAGPPGTGKTSLAKIITSAFAPSERIREVAVSRGWTSQKDLIGFSNPLSKHFYESQTKLYSLLRQLNFEWETETFSDSPLAFIILDEANLSPLEHYWSTFYNATDSYATHGKPLTINLGQSESVQHANTLRFIGTINYDQTTEELSPRILDRINIIRLMPYNFQVNKVANTQIQHIQIPFREIVRIFKLFDFTTEPQVIQMNETLLSKYEEIKDSFQKLNIYISPRIELGIKRYCQLASTLMTEDTRPLDYCIAQRLLPLINIQGNHKAELDILMKKVQGLNLNNSVSEAILKKIIHIGNMPGYTQDTYNYFLTLTHV